MDAKINNELQLDDFLNVTTVAIAWSNRRTQRVEYVNPAFVDMFGYTLEDVRDSNVWLTNFYPDEHFLHNVFLPWREQEDKRQDQGLPATQLELQVCCKDKRSRYVRLRYKLIGDKRLIHFVDITDYWVTSQRLKLRSEMLDMVVKGSSLPEMLHAIVKKVQDEIPESFCSVLLLDETGTRLVIGAAPDMPEFYNNAIHGIEIGAKVGSCGAAAFLNKRVVVEDINTHENWQAYLPLTREAGVAACWSQPVRALSGEVIGTFAIYHTKPATPSEKDIELIHFASNVASIAIENRRSHQALQQRAFYDHLTGLANRGYFLEQAESAIEAAIVNRHSLAMIMMDVDFFKEVNDQYGHKVGDMVLQALSSACEEELRSDDIIGRMGGEEFAVILSNTPQPQVLEIAERLRSRLASLNMVSDDQMSITFTVSLGVAYAKPDDEYSVDALLIKSDKALYKAKEAGRNCVVLEAF
ncbi:diguanylate cyclase [Marinomonas sp.]